MGRRESSGKGRVSNLGTDDGLCEGAETGAPGNVFAAACGGRGIGKTARPQLTAAR